jgi:hypothetical protein
VESVGSSGRWRRGGSMARHGCRRGGACSGEMRRHRLCFQDSSQWIAARSTARLAEGTGVGEGLEAGASWWQLTVAAWCARRVRGTTVCRGAVAQCTSCDKGRVGHDEGGSREVALAFCSRLTRG